jgi:3-methyladenine DNA glycosylase/8-oxoguanine DNA glycosylase
MEMEQRFEVAVPLDLARTLRSMEMWGATTWLKTDESGCWFAQREDSGPATVHIVQRPGHLHARAWGPGAEELLARVPQLAGLDNVGVEDIRPAHPVVRQIIKRFQGLRVGRSGRVYSRLVSAGLAQKVTGVNGKSALRQVAWRFGEPAPGPREDLRLLPHPKELRRLPYYVFHPLNIEQHRAELIRRIADRASALQRAARMPGPQALEHLQKLRGIGPWTAGIVVGGSLGYADAVPLADIHLPNIVATNLAGEPRATDERMLELLQPYAGARGLVVRLLKTGGAKAPRYGPRMDVNDIRGL